MRHLAISGCCEAPIWKRKGQRECTRCGQLTEQVLVEAPTSPQSQHDASLDARLGEARGFVKGHVEVMTTDEIRRRNQR